MKIEKTKLALGGVLMVLTAIGASAQQSAPDSQVTIQASHQVTKKVVGRTATGIPIELVQLNRHVGFSDLDLSTSAGAAELEKRIKETAREACKQIDTLYPLDFTEDNDQTCINDAVSHAMAQAKQAIAAAQSHSDIRSAAAPSR
jgi:UrcA family protein